MARDHYIPQVHLRQFCTPDEQGKLFVVNKSDLKEFWPRPSSICAIQDGNSNKHLTDTQVLERLYAIFEPEYPRALRELRAGKKSYFAREVFSAFVSAVNLSSPAFKRKMRPAIGKLITDEAHRIDQVGELPSFPTGSNSALDGKSFSELFNSGKIDLDIDMTLVQAMASTRIPNIVDTISSSDWDVLHFPKENPVLTSDFPLALLEQQDQRNLARFLPLAPDMGIIVYTRRIGIKNTSPSQTHYKVFSKSEIATLNRCIIRSAENHVISHGCPKWLVSAVKKHQLCQLVVNPHKMQLEYGKRQATET